MRYVIRYGCASRRRSLLLGNANCIRNTATAGLGFFVVLSILNICPSSSRNPAMLLAVNIFFLFNIGVAFCTHLHVVTATIEFLLQHIE